VCLVRKVGRTVGWGGKKSASAVQLYYRRGYGYEAWKGVKGGGLLKKRSYSKSIKREFHKKRLGDKIHVC